MTWFLIALCAPILFAISNFIDKYLITKYFKDGGVGALIIYSALIGIILMPVYFILDPNVLNIEPKMALLIILSGMIYIISLLPYLYAIQYDDVSTATPLFQIIPVFSYFLGYFFLGETLSGLEIFASLLIIMGAITLTVEKKLDIFKFNSRVFWMILLSSLLLSLNAFLFKFVAISSSFLTTGFWEYTGISIVAVFLLIFVKSYREQFLSNLKVNKRGILGLNFINEIINIVGKISLNFASLLAPLALVSVVNGFHPFFVLALGIVLTKFFPRLGKENIAKGLILQKVIAIMVMMVGGYLLTR